MPMQAASSRERLGLRADELPEEMQLMLPDGRCLGGMTALAYMARSVWWLWPGAILVELPGLRFIAKAGYRWVARNRRCLGGACRPPGKRRGTSAFFEMP